MVFWVGVFVIGLEFGGVGELLYCGKIFDFNGIMLGGLVCIYGGVVE